MFCRWVNRPIRLIRGTMETMPTPFMHLVVATDLLAGGQLNPDQRRLLTEQRGPFLLGNIAPDARHSGGVSRVRTHFFHCDAVTSVPAWQTMLAQYPTLADDHRPAVRAFLAGYVAHLAMDVVFCQHVVYPLYVAFWDTPHYDAARLRMHLLLAWLDARDYGRVAPEVYHALGTAEPDAWLPFIRDVPLADWRDLVREQLPPNGTSQTNQIMGERVGLAPDAVARIIESEEQMSVRVWQFIAPALVAQTRQLMAAQARRDVADFLNGVNGKQHGDS